MLILHSDTDKMKTASLPGILTPGFGDFLRGSICLHQYCEANDIDHYISFKDHPVGQFLEKVDYGELLEKAKNSELLEFPFEPNKPNPFSLIEKNQQITKILETQGFVKLITNNHPEAEINTKTKEHIKRFIKPNNYLQEKINQSLNKLKITPHNYCVLHIRLGDTYMQNCHECWAHRKKETLEQNVYDLVSNTVKSIINPDLVLLSDSWLLKSRFIGQCKVLENIPVHSGSKLDTMPLDLIEQTLIDFFIIANSQAIYQISGYMWGSGFSDRCHELYEIPIQRFVLPHWVHGMYI